ATGSENKTTGTYRYKERIFSTVANELQGLAGLALFAPPGPPRHNEDVKSWSGRNVVIRNDTKPVRQLDDTWSWSYRATLNIGTNSSCHGEDAVSGKINRLRTIVNEDPELHGVDIRRRADALKRNTGVCKRNSGVCCQG